MAPPSPDLLAADPLVSVVIPAYQRARSLGRAIDSVRAQDVADWELIVVDDGSSDGTAAVAEAYGDPRLRVIRHPVNRGASAARNSGVAAARGRYVAFLDSDDEWMPGKLAAQLAALEAGTGAPDLLCTGFVLRYEGSQREDRRFPRPRPGEGWFAAMLDGCHVSPGSTLMGRRAVFAATGPLDESLPRLEDWDWLLRALPACRFDCLPVATAIVHVGGPPRAAAVEEAARRLPALHEARILEAAGSAGLARFRASLAIERAVAALHEGRRAAGALRLAEAFGRSPGRTLRFIRQAAGRRMGVGKP